LIIFALRFGVLELRQIRSGAEAPNNDIRPDGGTDARSSRHPRKTGQGWFNRQQLLQLRTLTYARMAEPTQGAPDIPERQGKAGLIANNYYSSEH
jgi:hypothetical protein